MINKHEERCLPQKEEFKNIYINKIPGKNFKQGRNIAKILLEYHLFLLTPLCTSQVLNGSDFRFFFNGETMIS